VEKLPQTIELIFRLIGKPAPSSLPEENVSASRFVPSEPLLALIRKQNYYDYRLHEFATKLLERKMAHQS